MGAVVMAENPFLQGLTPEQYDLLASLFVPVEFPVNRIIFHQGEAALYMYLLVEGEVSIRYKPEDGPQIRLTRLRAGDVFGWSSVVGNASYTSDAIATTQGRALRAPGLEIRNLCAQYPTAGAQVLEKLAIAVAPRWVDSQTQVRHLLRRGMMDSSSPLDRDAPA
jgi:CRP-like cAMP-binding protein